MKKFMIAYPILFAVGILMLLLVTGFLYFFLHGMSHDLPQGKLTLGGKIFTVEIAETMITRMQGLSGRDPLPDGTGMLFIFSNPGRNGFWMKDMKFALDFVWIRDHKVIGVTENVPAPTSGTKLWSLPIYYPPEDADQVFEIDAGAVAREGIKAGDAVVLTRG